MFGLGIIGTIILIIIVLWLLGASHGRRQDVHKAAAGRCQVPMGITSRHSKPHHAVGVSTGNANRLVPWPHP
jgi:hypothetical protein